MKIHCGIPGIVGHASNNVPSTVKCSSEVHPFSCACFTTWTRNSVKGEIRRRTNQSQRHQIGAIPVVIESSLVIVMATFGTTAPLGSVTVPTIVASCPAARKGNPRSWRKRTTVRLRQQFLAAKVAHANKENEKRIDRHSPPTLTGHRLTTTPNLWRRKRKEHRCPDAAVRGLRQV